MYQGQRKMGGQNAQAAVCCFESCMDLSEAHPADVRMCMSVLLLRSTGCGENSLMSIFYLLMAGFFPATRSKAFLFFRLPFSKRIIVLSFSNNKLVPANTVVRPGFG